MVPGHEPSGGGNVLATQSRDLLESLFGAAVGAAHPSRCLPPSLPDPPQRGRLIVLAAGKGAGSLTEVAESYYLARMRGSASGLTSARWKRCRRENEKYRARLLHLVS